MSLYQKYRPKNLAEVVGQAHIKQTLQNAIQFDRVGHAYLFSGPHGVGKTSIARILARGVNCTGEGDGPCNKCTNCSASLGGSDLNIIEIDAASNRGIDDIRSLKEKVAFPPQGAKRKVYIIDEVHMLSKDAFNALLKTLEEPPKHSLFILATTELHKVLDTIISRTQHFELKKITDEQIANHLESVAKSEGLNLSHDAALLIATNAAGSLRDSLSLLDQLKNYNQNIDLEAVRFVIGIPAQQEMLDLIAESFAKNHAKVLALTDGFMNKGYDAGNIIDSLIETLRLLVYAKTKAEIKSSLPDNFLKTTEGSSLEEVFFLINNLIIAKAQMRWVALPIIPLQLALFGGAPTASSATVASMPSTEALPAVAAAQNIASKVAEPIQKVSVPDTAESKLRPEEAQKESTAMPEAEVSLSKEELKAATPTNAIDEALATETIPAEKSEPAPQAASSVNVNWEDFVKKIREENMKLSSLLVIAKFVVIGQTLEISVPFNFYVERIEETESKALIKKIYKQMTGTDIEPKAVLGVSQEAEIKETYAAPPSSPSSQNARESAPPLDDSMAPPAGFNPDKSVLTTSSISPETNSTLTAIKEVFGELVH